ncbi:MAG: NUDIX hydrolase [Ignisphaera sp.]
MVSDRIYPRYAIAAVGCVVVRDGRILLVKRGYPPRAGFWSVPGGAIEAGEDIAGAAVRELEEETGVRARPIGIIDVYNAITKDESGRVQYHYVILDVLFDQSSIQGEVRPGGDAINVAWIPLEEVLSRDDVTTTTKVLVKKLMEKKNCLVPI